MIICTTQTEQWANDNSNPGPSFKLTAMVISSTNVKIFGMLDKVSHGASCIQSLPSRLLTANQDDSSDLLMHLDDLLITSKPPQSILVMSNSSWSLFSFTNNKPQEKSLDPFPPTAS